MNWVCFSCGELYIKQNKFNSARRAFVTALKLCPNFALCWQRCGENLLNLPMWLLTRISRCRLVDFEISQGVDRNEVFALLLSANSYLPENETLRQKVFILCFAEFSFHYIFVSVIFCSGIDSLPLHTFFHGFF
jgi:hypothetical protein